MPTRGDYASHFQAVPARTAPGTNPHCIQNSTEIPPSENIRWKFGTAAIKHNAIRISIANEQVPEEQEAISSRTQRLHLTLRDLPAISPNVLRLHCPHDSERRRNEESARLRRSVKCFDPVLIGIWKTTQRMPPRPLFSLLGLNSLFHS